MKNKKQVIFIILGMFLLTQIVGLLIIDKSSNINFFYDNGKKSEIDNLINIIFSFIIAIAIFLFFIQYDFKFILKLWFFLVVLISVFLFFYAIFSIFTMQKTISILLAALLSIVLSYFKIYRANLLLHNLTEIFIYSGLSILFVSFLKPFSIVLLLILISFYDMWAVWHSGIMQKMAKFQINEMKIFNGFIIPYLTSDIRKKIKMSKKSKNKKIKIKVPFALLGGGDVAFSLITAGVFLKSFGWISSIFVMIGSTLGLTYLMLAKEKGKFYPAMPFITIGIFLLLFIFFIIKLFFNYF